MLVWIDIDTTISKKRQKWQIVTKHWIHIADYQLCERGLQQQMRILHLIFPTLMWYSNPGLLGWDGWPHWKGQHCHFHVEYLWITCSSHYGYFHSFFHSKNTSIKLQYHFSDDDTFRSQVVLSRRLEGFRSRCRTLAEWMYFSPRRIW